MILTNFSKPLLFIVVITISFAGFSCRTDNPGNKDTMQRDHDNDPTRTENDRMGSESRPPTHHLNSARHNDSEDGVKIEATNFGDQEWSQLKQSLELEDPSAVGRSSVQSGEEIALGPWKEWENDRYQLVYSYSGDGGLWLKLQLDQNSTGSSDDAKILTKQEAESLQLSSVWNEMERAARYLEDSLNNQSGRTTEQGVSQNPN